jgi:RNA-directed DNA polymerase
VRYADDGNIHVRNRRAVGLQPTGLTRGERVMASVASFLTDWLKLRLNAAKSAVDRPEHRKVLGFSFKIGPSRNGGSRRRHWSGSRSGCAI